MRHIGKRRRAPRHLSQLRQHKKSNQTNVSKGNPRDTMPETRRRASRLRPHEAFNQATKSFGTTYDTAGPGKPTPTKSVKRECRHQKVMRHNARNTAPGVATQTRHRTKKRLAPGRHQRQHWQLGANHRQGNARSQRAEMSMETVRDDNGKTTPTVARYLFINISSRNSNPT